MYKPQVLFLAGTLALGGAAPVFAHEKEKAVTMADLPAAVQKTLEKEAKGGKIEELTKETHKDGAVTYEAEIVKDGKGTDIELNAAGKVVERGTEHDEKGEHESD